MTVRRMDRKSSTRWMARMAFAAFLLGAGFLAGAVVAISRQWGSPLVTVVVQNHASKPLRAVSLGYGSCGQAGTAFRSGEPLGPGESRMFQFLVCGEGSYTVDAVLDSGQTLTASAYVERGYHAENVVENERIRSQTTLYPR